MTGPPDAGTDRAGFLLAVADLREELAERIARTRFYGWFDVDEFMNVAGDAIPGLGWPMDEAQFMSYHSPKLALAEVALWRQVAEDYAADDDRGAFGRLMDFAVGAARAYLTGAGG